MGKSAPSAPPAPDPVATARAQTESNVETARLNAQLNRVNQVTPYGNLTYSIDPRADSWLDQQLAAERSAYASSGGSGPTGAWVYGGEANGDYWDPFAGVTQGTGQGGGSWNEAEARARLMEQNPYRDTWIATQTLSPEQQRLYELSTQAQTAYGQAALAQLQRAQGTLSEPFNFDVRDRSGDVQRTLNFGQFGLPNETRAAVEQALTERLRPQQERDLAALNTRLANQGITIGSQAWNAAQDAYGRSVNDARLAVTAAGGEEQQRLYNMALGAANLNNAAVGQQAGLDTQRLQQLLALRAQPINEASALLTGSQVQQPNFVNVPTATVAPTDVLGAYQLSQNAAQASYNARNQAYMANLSGMYNLAGTALGAGLKWGMS